MVHDELLPETQKAWLAFQRDRDPYEELERLIRVAMQIEMAIVPGIPERVHIRALVAKTVAANLLEVFEVRRK